MTSNQKFNADGVKRHMQEIHNSFQNDPNFMEAGQFVIKVTPENFSGRGRKRGLVWDLQEAIFGSADEVFKHGIPELEKLGYKVERMGKVLQVRK